MFHHVMRLADSHHIPVQVHTGAFAGTGGVITNSKPTHLVNTFLLYPRIKFDIFHLSFPYEQELGPWRSRFRTYMRIFAGRTCFLRWLRGGHWTSTWRPCP